MENSANTKVAVIGLGNIGRVVAGNLAKNNRPVIVADRNLEKATLLAGQLGDTARPLSISDAIKEADIIVMAVWFNAIKEIFYQYEALLAGKIIIDPSNPIAPNDKGGFDKIIGENESAGLINASVLPEGAKLAKALGTLGAATLDAAANQQPESSVLFYATDDLSINEEVEKLILDNGFVPLRVGGLDQSIRIEVFGDLHEFGALGKAVTLQEAKEKL
ncbi:NAD(P)-binding domain-containing protein [Emticicia sp. CRIBPO]|uniref:NADPH-dependent F420 reductase n=1 Tax=Emticicia sp. CRIBPO TaxID=2683258 RepID=UPI001413695C|nr:NAD(P)-binding domain-containing protein [Emticicia sp. CRIBPO]NBA84309.1 NAD(P)-binding domain-containing protein [Emticicia sp. CRIBPO]